MAVTVQGRKHRYDNIAAGSATGTERTISGALPPAKVQGSGSNVATGSAHPASNVSDNMVTGAATSIGERLG